MIRDPYRCVIDVDGSHFDDEPPWDDRATLADEYRTEQRLPRDENGVLIAKKPNPTEGTR